MSLSNQNSVMLTGRIGNALEIKETQSGRKVLSFSLAHNEGYKKGDEWVNNTHWFNCVAWNKLAEAIAERANKGDEITVSGKLRTSSYSHKETGKDTTVVELNLEDFKVEKTATS
jgi:single-strand DNA-binding protein